MTLLAPRIGNYVSYVTRITDDIDFAWQAKYFGEVGRTLVAPRIVNDVSSVMRINHEIHFAWQAQYLVKLDCDSCCSAHCK